MALRQTISEVRSCAPNGRSEQSERRCTISRYIQDRSTTPETLKNWRAFLRNHSPDIAAMDFFTVPTATFRVLYVFVVIHHGSRRILHTNVTVNPTATWVSQQLREAFPFDDAPKYMIHDNDRIFGENVKRTIASLGIASKPTAIRAPWQNGICERWNGTCRRELLEHIVPLSEAHLRQLLGEFVEYYHQDRSHLSLGKDTPAGRETTPRPSPEAEVVSLPRVGGVHHRYEWRDAA